MRSYVFGAEVLALHLPVVEYPVCPQVGGEAGTLLGGGCEVLPFSIPLGICLAVMKRNWIHHTIDQ